MERYRYGAAWRLLGLFGIFLAVAIPIMVGATGERFDTGFKWLLGIIGTLGIWCYAYYRKYAVTIFADHLRFDRLGHRPVVIPWREIKKVREIGDDLVIVGSGQRRLVIPDRFSGYEAVAVAAARHLPEAVFSAENGRPLLEEEERLFPEFRRLEHEIEKYAWLTAAGVWAMYGAVPAVVAYAAGLALEHIDFGRNPGPLVQAARSLLDVLSWWGYFAGAVFVVYAAVFAIMAAQEAARARRS